MKKHKKFLLLILLAFLCTGLQSAVPWSELVPSRLKRPEAVSLERNPFQTGGMASGQVSSAQVQVKRGDQDWLRVLLQQRVRGLVRMEGQDRILFGRRVLGVGQEIVLSRTSAGAGDSVRLRLKQVEQGRLRFFIEDAQRAMPEELVLSLGGGLMSR